MLILPVRLAFQSIRSVSVVAVLALTAAALVIASIGSRAAAKASACQFSEQGDGHVTDIIDGRSFRLSDGREIRLTGIETSGSASATALAALIRDRDVVLRGNDDAPDRYGRQSAFAFVAGSEVTLQRALLTQGVALVAADVTDKGCAEDLKAAETEARMARLGIWADATVIKNAESPDDILAGAGRFSVVEGKVLSVRQAGAVTYLNFGRNWTRGFAVTISKRAMPALEATGLAVKALENQRIRVRGWVEARPGPRIDVVRAAQIEILDHN